MICVCLSLSVCLYIYVSICLTYTRVGTSSGEEKEIVNGDCGRLDYDYQFFTPCCYGIILLYLCHVFSVVE